MVSFTAGSGGYYFCDTVDDMVRIDAMRGDCANVRGDVYMFNGGSWTLMFDDSEYRNLLKPKVAVACLDCKYVKPDGGCKIDAKWTIENDRCMYWTPYGGGFSVGANTMSRRAIYLGKPPFCFDGYNITRPDYALTVAWYERFAEAVVWSGHFVGNAEVGDTVKVHDGLRWKIVDRHPNGDYVLERVR